MDNRRFIVSRQFYLDEEALAELCGSGGRNIGELREAGESMVRELYRLGYRIQEEEPPVCSGISTCFIVSPSIAGKDPTDDVNRLAKERGLPIKSGPDYRERRDFRKV